jgi:hypothetical protein
MFYVITRFPGFRYAAMPNVNGPVLDFAAVILSV